MGKCKIILRIGSRICGERVAIVIQRWPGEWWKCVIYFRKQLKTSEVHPTLQKTQLPKSSIYPCWWKISRKEKDPLKHDMDEKEQAFLTDFWSLSFAEFATNWAQIPVYYSIISGISNF